MRGMTRALFLAACCLVALAGCGDNPPPPGAANASANAAAPSAPIGDTVRVRLETEAGPIVLELDHRHAPGDHLGYATFGRVLEGMDVVRRIHAMATDPHAGSGSMRGEMLSPPVRILSARRG